MFGYSRTDRRWNAINPSRTMTRLSTVARTGRLIKSSEMNMNRAAGDGCMRSAFFLRGAGGDRRIDHDRHRRSVLQLELAIDDDHVLRPKALHDLHFAR